MGEIIGVFKYKRLSFPLIMNKKNVEFKRKVTHEPSTLRFR
jgi:hypothetical protein